MALRFPVAMLIAMALAPLAAASAVDEAFELALTLEEQYVALGPVRSHAQTSTGSEPEGSAPHDQPAPEEPASPPRRSILPPEAAPVAPLVEPVLDPVLAGVPADFDLDWVLHPRTPDAPLASSSRAPTPAPEAAAPLSTSSAAQAAPLAAPALLAASVAAAGGASTLSVAWDRLRRFGLFAVLYARIAKERLLDHGARERLLDQARLTPGAPLADLARAADIPRNTAVYHLRRLEKEGLLSSTRQGRVRLYFAPGGAQRREDAEGLAALRHPVSRALAAEVVSSPGLDQRALCEKMGLTPSLAHWHATRLEGAGIVQRQRDGRHVRYYPGPAHRLLSG